MSQWNWRTHPLTVAMNEAMVKLRAELDQEKETHAQWEAEHLFEMKDTNALLSRIDRELDDVEYLGDYSEGIKKLKAELEAEKQNFKDCYADYQSCTKELHEQARLNGMGSEREGALMARIAECERERDKLLAKIESLEPVAWMDVDGCLISDTTHPQNYTPLYSLEGIK